VDRWRPEVVVLDSFAVAVPLDAAPGDWQVQLKLARQPHYPNYHIRDYFSDTDYYSGVPVAAVRIAPRGATGGQ
jgi:hypothetical protein